MADPFTISFSGKTIEDLVELATEFIQSTEESYEGEDEQGLGILAIDCHHDASMGRDGHGRSDFIQARDLQRAGPPQTRSGEQKLSFGAERQRPRPGIELAVEAAVFQIPYIHSLLGVAC